MKKPTIAVILLLAAVGAGCKDAPKISKSPEIQCRAVLADPNTKDVYASKWGDCSQAESKAEEIYETVDHPGWVVWTSERTLTGKKWSDSKIHSKPREIPDNDFTGDWNNS